VIINRTYKEADPSKYITFTYKGHDAVHPALKGRLAYYCEVKGKRLTCTRGFVTSAEQKAITDQKLRENPTWYRDSTGAVYKPASGTTPAQCMVAAPGNSNHEFAQAMDISEVWFNSVTNTELAQFGLYKPMDYEPWHVQVIETKGVSKEEIKRYFKEGNMFGLREFQTAAKAVGVYTGNIDGLNGPKTQAAAEVFKPIVDYIISTIQRPKFTYEKISETHVLRVNPMDLRATVVNKKPREVPHSTFINANFFSGTSVVGWLISEGKVIRERHEDIQYGWKGNPKGTFIVYKDGTVETGWKYDSEITQIVGKIWFCCQGFNLFPPNLTVWKGLEKEGFPESIGRETIRVSIGYDGKDVIIAVRHKSDATRAQATMINLGCKNNAICLDSGTPATLKKDGEFLVEGSTTLQAIIYV
jgi:hypothetical protein